MKKHNFYAGPSILSEYTIRQTADAILDFEGTGLSLMEISHRSKQFVAVCDQARALIKELLHVPEDFEVVFLGGGASLQFAMAPFNFLETKAAYLDSGYWASKAIKEAKLFGEVQIVGSSKDDNYSHLPKNYQVPSDADYFYFCSNNTIYGTELHEDPHPGVPVIADMSSDIFSRPIDFSSYGLIFAGAQKNLAPSGVTLVIVRKSMLDKVSRPIPTILNYKTHVENESMFNTPPVVPIYAALQTLLRYKELGGIEVIHDMNKQKAALLYEEIDTNPLFKGTVTCKEDRSLMNVCFVMSEGYEHLEDEFDKYASEAGMVGIKGHRSVGGFRASIYNAMPIASVQALVDTMRSFAQLKTQK
ncbi:MAG: 3-phosphoserine/phosphohydroxythreonine transaminase [Bacteroidales bacterium]|jgi:phosphoserine aminotransferase